MSAQYVSWPDIEKILGTKNGKTFCHARGGLPTYIPQRPSEKLLSILDERAVLALCKEYGGSDIIPAMGPSEVQTKQELAIELLSQGMSELEAAEEMRRRGVRCCIRTVQGAKQILTGKKSKRKGLEGVHRLPMCILFANGRN